jgi:hypothetical protein
VRDFSSNYGAKFLFSLSSKGEKVASEFSEAKQEELSCTDLPDVLFLLC